MIQLINYADERYRRSQKYCSSTGVEVGECDEVIEYGPESIQKIDMAFYIQNKKWFVLGDPQIGKYGLWRPIIVKDAFDKLNEDDYLIYVDSGCYFINSVHHIISYMERCGDSIFVGELPFLEKYWTKREVFQFFNCDVKSVTDTNQRASTFFVIKKDSLGEKLVDEFYQAAKVFPSLFTDEIKEKNYEGFIQNRHNQSVLSVLTKKLGVRSSRDVTEYGNHPKLYSYYNIPSYCFFYKKYHECTYPQILVQHRRGIVTDFVRFFGFVRSKFPSFVGGAFIRAAQIRNDLRRKRK